MALEDMRDAASLLAEDHAKVDVLFQKLFGGLDVGATEEAFAHLDLLWARLAMHIRAENLCLFPALLEAFSAKSKDDDEASLSFDDERAVIARLREDHNFFMVELAEAIKTGRKMLAKLPGEDAREKTQQLRRIVQAVRSRLDAHNDLEEAKVYRWTAALLSLTEQEELASRIQHELKNIPPRFNDIDYV